MSGRETLEQRAPEAAALLLRLQAVPAPNRSDPAIAEFADQFALDVSATDPAQRAAFLAATGDGAFAEVQRIYAADITARAQHALDGLFGPSAWDGVADPVADDTWNLIEDFLAAVARLRALDPTLTELVRLRGARLHDCAVCKSRRSQDAIDHGADAAMFAAVDDHAASGLASAAKAALALTDSIVLRPVDTPADAANAADQARRWLSEAQCVEVVLDVVRNAANKIAVALGADQASVTEGVELFTTAEDGELRILGAAPAL